MEAAAGKPDAAADHLHHALARADELGLRPIAALCHETLARLHRAAGRAETAERHGDAARALLAAMGRAG